MNQKTLLKLEYNKIITLLEEQAASFRGRQLCRKLKPMTDLERIDTFRNRLQPHLQGSLKRDVSLSATHFRLRNL